METKLNKQRHGSFQQYRKANSFFRSKAQRKAFFWHVLGDATAYFIVFYLVGYMLGAGLMFYILFWPILKALFGL